jgi:glutamyl-tRNA synthetase
MFNSSTINDQVLLKSDGFPTYHLGVVVDDHDMMISHIFRGEEWISSTPKHILLYQALGWPKPIYGHIPVFLNPDGQGKMSKRKGEVSAQSFLDRGYLPEAMLNFFMILGWTPKDQREFITLQEYINEFDPANLSPKSVAFDLKKLDWINGIYIRKLSIEQLASKLSPFIPSDFPKELIAQVLPLINERLIRLDQFEELTSYFYKPIAPTATDLTKKSDPKEVVSQLELVISALEGLKSWNHSEIEQLLRDLVTQRDFKKSQFFMMLRVAATGSQFTPPLFETLAVIGPKIVLSRLTDARNLLGD